MKKTLFATLILLSLVSVSCFKSNYDGDLILVQFENTTGDDITDAVYDFGIDHLTTIGLIPAHRKTDYTPFAYFETGDGVPMGSLRGQSGSDRIFISAGLWCGTGVDFKQLEPGLYTLVISKYNSDFGVYYDLKFKE